MVESLLSSRENVGRLSFRRCPSRGSPLGSGRSSDRPEAVAQPCGPRRDSGRRQEAPTLDHTFLPGRRHFLIAWPADSFAPWITACHRTNRCGTSGLSNARNAKSRALWSRGRVRLASTPPVARQQPTVSPASPSRTLQRWPTPPPFPCVINTQRRATNGTSPYLQDAAREAYETICDCQALIRRRLRSCFAGRQKPTPAYALLTGGGSDASSKYLIGHQRRSPDAGF